MSSGSKRLLPVIVWLLPIIPAWVFYHGEWESMRYPQGAATLFGVFGICNLLTSLLLSTRIRWIDRIWGHDRVLRFHSLMAASSLLLLVIHRQLKVWDGPVVTVQTLFGTASLLLILIVSAVSFLFMVKKPFHRVPGLERFRLRLTTGTLLNYRRLKILHNVLPLAAFAAVVHVLTASATKETALRTILVSGYALLTLLAYVNFRFIRPRRQRRRIFTVTEVRKPGKDVTELRFSGDLPKYQSGQYGYWRLNSRAVSREEHPFNICTCPGDVEIGFSAKDLGDYTAALKKVRPGDTALFDGPYGNFTLPSNSRAPMLFIAGGIGITPFKSMAAHMAETRSIRPATLIWAVKRRADLVYSGDFLTLVKRIPNFRYKPVIEIQEAVNLDVTLADYESGYVTRGLIMGLCPDLTESGTVVYLCCPEPMRSSVLKILDTLGVSRESVRVQRF
jgi:predicted ferric reductase